MVSIISDEPHSRSFASVPQGNQSFASLHLVVQPTRLIFRLFQHHQTLLHILTIKGAIDILYRTTTTCISTTAMTSTTTTPMFYNTNANATTIISTTIGTNT